jgi:hypothetical protein
MGLRFHFRGENSCGVISMTTSTQHAIAYYLRTYTKQALAALLVEAIEAGELPALPDTATATPILVRRGRPTKAELAERIASLRQQIKHSWPAKITLRDLGAASGLHIKTVEKLQHNPAFLADLSPVLSGYFTSLRGGRTARLSSWWRAILTAHFYIQALEAPGVNLPLFTAHALMWNSLTLSRLSPKYLSDRNFTEWGIVHKYTEHFTAADWTAVIAPTTAFVSDEHNFPCLGGCEIVSAYHTLDHPAHGSVEAARTLLDPLAAHPWGNNKTTDQPISGHHGALLKQLIEGV